jgi:predicted nucleic acid-binding protein
MTTALPPACVLDANVVIRLFVPGAYMPEIQQYFVELTDAGEVHAPDLLPVECANVLWKYVRAGEYDVAQVQRDLIDLLALTIRWVPTGELLIYALEIACAYGASTYDACYVALAEQLKLPLVTADKKLAAKLVNAPCVILTLDSLFSTAE